METCRVYHRSGPISTYLALQIANRTFFHLRRPVKLIRIGVDLIRVLVADRCITFQPIQLTLFIETLRPIPIANNIVTLPTGLTNPIPKLIPTFLALNIIFLAIDLRRHTEQRSAHITADKVSSESTNTSINMPRLEIFHH